MDNTTPTTPGINKDQIRRVIKETLNSTLAGIIGSQRRVLTIDKGDPYKTNYTVYGSVNLLADDMATPPLRVYRGDEIMPDDFVFENGFNIHQPHPRMSFRRLHNKASKYYFYRGEYMVYISLAPLFTLEVVNPRLMQPYKRDSFGNITSWKWNNSLVIPDEQLIYEAMDNLDGERGYAPKDVLSKEIESDAFAVEFVNKFFENFAQTGIELFDDKGMITPEQMDVLVDSLNQVVETGEMWKAKGYPYGVRREKPQTMQEMQFGDMRDKIRDRILSTNGIHKSEFGVTDQVDRAVADAAARQKWTRTLRPALLKVQESYNIDLMRRYYLNYKIKFDLSEIEVLQESQTEKLTRAKVYHELGYTTNEINELLNLGMKDITDPIGNERFVPTTLIPYSEISLPAEENPKPEKSLSNELDIIIKEVEIKEDKSKRTYGYQNRFDRAQRKTEKEMASKLGSYFSKQLGKVLSIVKSNKEIKAIDETLLLTEIMNLLMEEKDTLATTMEPLYTNGALRGSTLALNTLKSEIAPIANEMVVQTLTNEIKRINNHTYRLIRTQVKDSLNSGETIADMTKRIQKVYKFNSSRARTIARTESLKVMTRSTDVEYKKAKVEKKRWLSSPGARDSHAKCTAQGAIPYDQSFHNGLRYPGDAGPAAEVVNCRCCIAPEIE